jgi:hypothetical protein
MEVHTAGSNESPRTDGSSQILLHGKIFTIALMLIAQDARGVCLFCEGGYEYHTVHRWALACSVRAARVLAEHDRGMRKATGAQGIPRDWGA